MSARVVAFRVIATAGAAFAALLLADDLRRVPSFCPFASGCAAVTTSVLGKPLGVPLSALGLTAFAGFFALTLIRATACRRLLGPAAVAAGAVGLALAATQFFVLRRLCRLCLVVDGAGMLLAAVALGVPTAIAPASESRRCRAAWFAVALSAVVAPLAWSALRPPPIVPSEVRAAWIAGKINVVEITDFTCPFCRRTHDALDELKSRLGDDVHLARFVAPGAANADGVAAARAYQCALRQGRGEALARRLYATEGYSRDHLRKLAGEAELELSRFDADWDDPTIDAPIAAVRRWVDAQELDGLPQVWVQEILLFGEQTPESLEIAVRRVRPAGEEQ